MANSATADTALKIYVKGALLASPVIPVRVTMDTTSSDLTLYTPASTNYVGIVGATFSEITAATNVTLKSGSTTLTTLELAAGTPFAIPLSKNPWIVSNLGEALKVNVSAVVSTMLLYVVEFKELYLD